MRLVRLKIKNIASLKGEHVINFKEVEAHSPLFAITGETGAGKSTILNSIGLSLYGEIYKKNVTQVDVVTLGEKDGQIELIFQIKGRHYLADWRAKVRKQNGELLKAPQIQRYLYELDGDDFDANRNITNLKTEELLHLDFDQFTKCIILNQGEFARFLASSFTERKEILEKLYPGEMLESLSKELRGDLDSLVKSRDEIDIELKALQGDGQNGKDLEEQRNILQKNLQDQESYFKCVETLDYHYVSMVSYHQKYADNKKRLESIKIELARETTKYNSLLKESQILAEAFAKVQKEQETELPRLQNFLKEEEKLKHLDQSIIDLKAKEALNTKKLTDLTSRINENKTRIEEIALKKKNIISEIKIDIESLRTNASLLEIAFDSFQEKESFSTQLSMKQMSLDQLEIQGKELAQELTALKERKSQLNPDAEKIHSELVTKKKNITLEIDTRQRQIIQGEELKKQVLLLEKSTSETELRKAQLTKSLAELKSDLFPIETTLKLEGLLNAVEVCLTHPQVDDTGACPVCHTPIEASRWNALRKNISGHDLITLRQKAETLSRQIMKAEEESLLIDERHSQLVREKAERSAALTELVQITSSPLPTLESLDAEITKSQKEAWDLGHLSKEEQRVNTELVKVRAQYVQVKKEVATLSSKVKEAELKMSNLNFVNFTLGELNKDKIIAIKTDLKNLIQLNEIQAQLDKFIQEEAHFETNAKEVSSDLEKLGSEISQNMKSREALGEILTRELGDKKASELIVTLNLRVKELNDSWSKHDQELKKQESTLKEYQGRIYSHDEQTRDIDLQFTKELHAIHEHAQASFDNNEELTHILPKLRSFALELNSPMDLFVPLQDKLKELKGIFKESTNTLRMEFAATNERLGAWEKKQDRILLQQMKRKDLQEKIARHERLFEVLGKDELRTFVLSLVEENLIEQTNDELQKLCQGRYEIVHQSRRMKLTPEFYVLDKFREGGLRKVSTLSGGETFMVSLAMAIALAEMTRGQAEIDSLFIDEGFGTLDQDSLEDVLEMLAQIQTRGLMVGIISHIKTLTNAIPVNLVLNKRQDGTSNISLLVN